MKNYMISGDLIIKKIDTNSNTIIQEIKQPMHSFSKYAIDSLASLFYDIDSLSINSSRTWLHNTADVYDNTWATTYDYRGESFGTHSPSHSLNNSYYANNDCGIVIGSSSISWNYNDNKLISKYILSGAAGFISASTHTAICLPTSSSNPMSDLWSETEQLYISKPLSRRFVNNTGNTININEIGIYLYRNYRRCLTYSEAYPVYTPLILFVRDVLETTFEFENGTTIEISYYFKFSQKINNQLIGLFLGQFWAMNNSQWYYRPLTSNGNIHSTIGYVNQGLYSDYGNSLRFYNTGSNSNVYDKICTVHGTNYFHLTWYEERRNYKPWTCINTNGSDFSYGLVIGYDSRTDYTNKDYCKEYTDNPTGASRQSNLTTYNMNYSLVYTLTDVQNNNYTAENRLNRIFKNNTSNDITINYIAILSKYCKSLTNGYYPTTGTWFYLLMYKEKINEITLKPGDSIYVEVDYLVSKS